MIDIQPEALATLQALQQSLTQPHFGLRLVVSGDPCHGSNLAVGWSAQMLGDDLRLDLPGLSLVADRRQWPQLKGAVITLAQRQGETGLEIKLQPAGCQCDTGRCEPTAAGSSC